MGKANEIKREGSCESEEKKFDVVALGEFLIDFTQSGVSQNGMPLFEQNPGGAPVNVLAALSRLNCKTAFIGAVGDDMHGRFLQKTLEDLHIDDCGLKLERGAYTTLAFVALKNGEREFSFSRKPGADTCLTEDDVDESLIKYCKILHVGSLSLTDEPSKSATKKAVRLAKENGVIVSFDPNYRASLWKSEKEAVAAIGEILPQSDIVKLSEEEAYLILGQKDKAAAAEYVLSKGASLVAITLGSDGSELYTKTQRVKVFPMKVRAIDTTGAGDAFLGGLLCEYLKIGKTSDELTFEDLEKIGKTASVVSGISVTRRGGIPSMPTFGEVEAAIKN